MTSWLLHYTSDRNSDSSDYMQAATNTQSSGSKLAATDHSYTVDHIVYCLKFH